MPNIDESACTCPEPDPDDGGPPGVAVPLMGKSHRRGCPVVQPIFNMQDHQARRMAEEHVAQGGIRPSPGEWEARRAQEAIESLTRRVDNMQRQIARILLHVGMVE